MVKKIFGKMIYKMKTKKISQIYDCWKNAMIKSDLDSLDEICDDNFLWTNYCGITNNKKDLINKIALGQIEYLSWMNEETNIKVVRDVAVLRTRELLKIKVYRQNVDVVQQVVILLIRQGGKWKLAGGQEIDSTLN